MTSSLVPVSRFVSRVPALISLHGRIWWRLISISSLCIFGHGVYHNIIKQTRTHGINSFISKSPDFICRIGIMCSSLLPWPCHWFCPVESSLFVSISASSLSNHQTYLCVSIYPLRGLLWLQGELWRWVCSDYVLHRILRKRRDTPLYLSLSRSIFISYN